MLFSPGLLLDIAFPTTLLLVCGALAVGVRRANTDEMRARMDDGSLAVRIREGKGAKARKVPYGEHERVLRIIDDWLIEAEITAGQVFPISTRTVQRILSRYPLYIDGEERKVQPHDLRRTYARRLYEAGVDLAAIQQNMGHADLKTTLGYIGQLNVDRRKPPEVFNFEL